jgi:hypothetical protein
MAFGDIAWHLLEPGQAGCAGRSILVVARKREEKRFFLKFPEHAAETVGPRQKTVNLNPASPRDHDIVFELRPAFSLRTRHPVGAAA